MTRTRRARAMATNVHVLIERGTPMALGDTGLWPEKSAATLVFGGGSARVSLRVMTSELDRLGDLIEQAKTQTSMAE
ncbi:hypothetical protein [Allokutzneria albata]|uniref:Uncharacterized protein n=1 Tax=Allokutzneria albata TaxID=211114 RepID=A0A1H0CL98_ALLAB|nr:hypothetical protein [Allokutzneria albata]SDN58649.1 hypothetical protein SAMN04489726_7294 [Allokutzneria albata]